jgi:hypothetical protein
MALSGMGPDSTEAGAAPPIWIWAVTSSTPTYVPGGEARWLEQRLDAGTWQ